MKRAKIITGIARFLSTALTPLLAGTYGTLLVLWTSVLCLLPYGTRVMTLVTVMGITCILPLMIIGGLHHFKYIHDRRLNDRNERLVPYVAAVACYVAAVFYLQHIHSPQWFVMFMAGSAVAVALDALINVAWKISAHLTGLGGMVALIYQIHVQGLSAFNLFYLLCGTIVLAGLVGTSRLVLKCHTVMQVLAGFALGYVCVTLAMKLFG